MANSKYPNELDTSIEIPVVRDNITEIGSDVMNSLRSAIFNMERTLGVNPQGSAGQTVASRLNTALDENGNIKKDALALANVLSGPIIDSDVAVTAAIKESKLRLTFPTQLLQDEISMLSGELDLIEAQIGDLSATLSAHIHPSASNRHKAIAITVEAATASSEGISLSEIDEDIDMQDFAEKLINAHINFNGTVSSTNKSHNASQIYFDNTEVSDAITSDDAQGAIEEVANIGLDGVKNVTLNIASNGRIRRGSILDGYEGNDDGGQLISNAVVTFVKSNSRTVFTLASATAPTYEVKEFDILTLSGAAIEDDNADYQIASFTNDGSGNITSIEIYGSPTGVSASGLTIDVSENKYMVYNNNGLNSVVRPRINKTNTPDIQIANPDSATIITSGIQPAEITQNESSFDISIDGGADVTIEAYDSNVSIQTIDSIVNKINEQAVDQHLNFMAYKLKSGTCYEIAIAHNIPNFEGDIKNRTLTISFGSANDGTSELGLNYILDTAVEGKSGNSYHINGQVLESFGNIISLDSTEVQLVASSNTLSLVSTEFSLLGVRAGDLLVIENSTSALDDGSYRIAAISGAIATVDDTSVSFIGAIDSDSVVYIIRCMAPVYEMNFTEIVSLVGSIMFDVFITEDKDVHYHKRLEVDGAIADSNVVASIIDISKNFLVSGETATITINTSGFAYITDALAQVGPQVYIGGTGEYLLKTADGLSFIKLAVFSAGLPISNTSVTLHGFDEISFNNYWICRGTFSTSLGRVLGQYSGSGIPSVLDKRQSGTAGETIISESFIEKYIEGPRNELRASGIISGLIVSNLRQVDSGEVDAFGNPIYYFLVDVSAGIAIVNGIRYEFSGQLDYRINTEDDFYIGLDNLGCIITGEQVTNPDGYTDGYSNYISSLIDQELAYLAFIDASEFEIIDFRYFINKLDYKAGKIIVSKTQNFGHFTSIGSAIEYARRFTEIYPNQGTPQVYIDQGDYELTETIIVDFDVKICGAGPDTVLTRSGAFALGTTPISGNIDFGDAAFLVGASSVTGSNRIENGVTFSDFTYKVSDTIEAVACAISITQPLIKTGDNAAFNATYRIENVNFIGNSRIDNAIPRGEYGIAIGQTDPTTYAPVGTLTMGSVIVAGCRFDRVGIEEGVIVLSDMFLHTFDNILVLGNIITQNGLLTAIEATGASIVTARVIEANNAIS